jgi:hypothetical protein
VEREAAHDQAVDATVQGAGGHVLESQRLRMLSRAAEIGIPGKRIDPLHPSGSGLPQGERHFAAATCKIQNARKVQRPLLHDRGDDLPDGGLVRIPVGMPMFLIVGTTAVPLVGRTNGDGMFHDPVAGRNTFGPESIHCPLKRIFAKAGEGKSVIGGPSPSHSVNQVGQ